ncbi:MAG: DUF4390 domain-containing protein [Limnohabitans sp.]
MLCLCVPLLALLLGPAQAQTSNTPGLEVIELRLEKSEGALLMQSSLRLELSPVVEDALQKGMPIYFVTEAEITRDRWYWYDKKINTVARHYRLAYQPLTRLWRLNVSREPIGTVGLASSLSQSFETLPEALTAIRRTVNWKVADLSEISSDNKYTLLFKFRLDVSQLARPFQMTAGGNAEWNLATQKTMRFTSDMGR